MAVRLPLTSLSSRKPNPTAWVRPSDWPTITDNADQFQALVSDTGDARYTLSYTVSGTGTTTINWGDGTSTTISGASTSTATKTYTPGTGTPCDRGYTTFRIRITKDPGITIGSIRFVGTPATYQHQQTGVGVLEVYYGNNIQTATNPSSWFAGFAVNGALLNFTMLEYVKLPATVTWTTMQNMFNGCFDLYVVVMPTSAANLSSLESTFNNCANLQRVILPANATAITNMSNTFSNCFNLVSCILPNSLNSCTSLSSTFSSCRYLQSMVIPSINACNSLSTVFIGCINLVWVRFTSLPTPAGAGTTINVSNMFNSCHSLQNVYFPRTCSSNGVYNAATMFISCFALRNIVFPINFNASAINQCFADCRSLFSVVFQSAMPNCTNLTSIFTSCTQLQKVVLPSSCSASGVNLSFAFVSCASLTSITIPTTYVITSLQSTFGSCTSLISVNINSAQNSCTTLLNAFAGCSSLTTVVLPTSLNTCNSLSSVFSDCPSLLSATFPSTMNAVTTMANCFANCRSLTSVTLPTSMSACNNFAAIFQSCQSLRQITFPATISASTTSFQSAMAQCNSVTTVTLPTTRSTSLNSLNTFMYACGQLTTINNLDLLGSTTGTPLVDGLSLGWFLSKVTSMTLSCPFTKLEIYGNNTTNVPIALNSLRLTNTNTGQWTGTSPQIFIRFTNLSTAALNTLFADIAAQGNVVSKTIDITGTTGAAGLSLANRQVLTTRGWTITG
jgi:hypothetical protein